MPEREIVLVTASAAATRRLGEAIGATSAPGDWLGLGGELGAGKTTLVQGIARGMGVPPEQAVVSPTFVLCNVYRGRQTIYHYDLYRLAQADELWQIGYEETAAGSGLCLVEWYQRVCECRPPAGLTVDIVITGARRRRMNLRAYGDRGLHWLSQIEKTYRA